MTDSSDDRSAIARAYSWVAQITTVSLEMVLPALAGVWLDRKFGTKFLFVLLGVVLGFVLGFWHLLKLTLPPNLNKMDADKDELISEQDKSHRKADD